MKITATVHQIQLTKEEGKTINRLGWAEAEQQYPKIKAYSRAGHGSEFDPETWKFYSRACMAEFANIKLDQDSIDKALEDIFAAGNGNPRNPDCEYYRSRNATSVSVGNIVLIGEEAYRVEGCGFKRVELPRIDARQATPAQ